MPHLLPLTDANANDATRSVFQSIKAKFAIVPNTFRTMGYAPDVLKATLQMTDAIQAELAPKLRELAYLKTSQLNNCEY
jgi:alkylhydroperoxidase family enzyme